MRDSFRFLVSMICSFLLTSLMASFALMMNEQVGGLHVGSGVDFVDDCVDGISKVLARGLVVNGVDELPQFLILQSLHFNYSI